MAENHVLKVLVDGLDPDSVAGVLPSAGQILGPARLAELGIEHLERNLKRSLATVLDLLSKTPLDSDTLAVESIRFTLLIDASAEISLVSLAKGTIGGETGLEFTITRRGSGSDRHE